MISINTGLRYSSITHPLVERTYSLSDHSIPPRKYSDFLRECVDAFISLVLKLNKSSTIPMLMLKNLRNMCVNLLKFTLIVI